MRNWSLEETVIRAQSAVAVAMQGVWDVFTHRPAYANDHPIPGCPSPSDCRGFGCAGDCSEALDADERLSDKEAAEHDDDRCYFGHHSFSTCIQDCQCPEAEREAMERRSFLSDDEVPNPTEPSLSDDELVAVRQLIEERFPLQAVETGHDMGLGWAAETFPQYTNSNLAAGARAAGSSPSEVSGQPPRPPSEGCPDPSRGNRLASVRGEGGAPDSGIHTSPGAPQPDLDWAGWATPAVLEVLSEHVFRWADHSSIGSNAHCGCGFRPRDLFAWHDHVAPEIVARVACDPARAIAALHNHKPQ